MDDALEANARDLEREIDWFAALVELRLRHYFADTPSSPLLPEEGPEAPELSTSTSPYARWLTEAGLDIEERLIVLLALMPHLRPQILDIFCTRNQVTQRAFSEFGGHSDAKAVTQAPFTPSVETALFLLSGDRLGARLRLLHRFQPGARLFNVDALEATTTTGDAPASAALLPHAQLLSLITRGPYRNAISTERFPAQRIRSELGWQDLVLTDSTQNQLSEIQNWLLHQHTLLEEWGMGKRIAPGYTSLFYGPPGTGKTLTACLLGKHCGCEVYKIDLSMVVSKYVGETEKNLARVFERAETRRCILFFDEADALFGRRTSVSEAHDRYANQEVSYLLQRIEVFNGVAILASNLKNNIDEAFLRRFQSVVHFPLPGPRERMRLWREAFSVKVTLDPALDLPAIAEKYALSGGTIINVARYASLCALGRSQTAILASDVEDGIRRELSKEGRAA